MNTVAQDYLAGDQVLTDVGVWTGKQPLVSLVLEVVSSLPVDDDGVARLGDASSGIRPKAMLSLLTYCYASGLYASDEIESAVLREPDIRYLSARARPTSGQIRRFRRQHRAALRACLSRVLLSAWGSHLNIDPVPGHDACLDAAKTAQDWAADVEPLFCRIADQRIDQSALLDSMALDE